RTTAGAFDTSLNGGDDGFVVKLNNTGTTVTFATYLGGSGADDPQDLDLDNDRNVYVVGRTTSANFPTTAGAFDTTANGGDDAFVTKLLAAGNALGYSTYLGGNGGDTATDIIVSFDATAYVAGFTGATNFPTAAAVQSATGGGTDGFPTRPNPPR